MSLDPQDWKPHNIIDPYLLVIFIKKRKNLQFWLSHNAEKEKMISI